MCIICKDFQLGKLNIKEARRNATEIMNTTEDKHEASHLKEVLEAFDVMDEIAEQQKGLIEPQVHFADYDDDFTPHNED